MAEALPNFFLVGAPKAGTTSLCDYLGQHPQIYMSPIKAPNFFADEIRPENLGADERRRFEEDAPVLRAYLDGPMTESRFGAIVTDWNDYRRLFRNAAGEAAIGEASDCYLWSAAAPSNIAARIPSARIVAVLREPVDRAFSQHLHHVSMGLVSWSFREQIEANLRHRGATFGADYPFLEMGMYSEQLARYFRHFPRENVRVYLYDDYRRDAAGMLSDLFGWLGVDPGFRPDLSKRQLELPVPRFTGATRLLFRHGMWNAVKSAIPAPVRKRMRGAVFRNRRSMEMNPPDRAFLAEYYRDEILRTQSLLDRDLSAWLRTG